MGLARSYYGLGATGGYILLGAICYLGLEVRTKSYLGLGATAGYKQLGARSLLGA